MSQGRERTGESRKGNEAKHGQRKITESLRLPEANCHSHFPQTGPPTPTPSAGWKAYEPSGQSPGNVELLPLEFRIYRGLRSELHITRYSTSCAGEGLGDVLSYPASSRADSGTDLKRGDTMLR